MRSNHTSILQSSHAILLLSGDYVLQLRDDKPNIAARGQWSLFGGMIKGKETPLQAVGREVSEELSIKSEGYRFLWYIDYYSDFLKVMVRTWFFVSDITSQWGVHKLTEGQAVGVFKFEQLADLDIPFVMRQAIERFHTQATPKDTL